MSQQHKTPKQHLSFRLDWILYEQVKITSEKYNITISEICEIGILSFFSTLKSDQTFKGLDLKEYAESSLREKLRNMTKKRSSEILSGALFVERLKAKIMRLVIKNKSKDLILEYISQHKQEVELYNSKQVIGEFESLIELIKFSDYDKIKTVLSKDFSKQYRLKLLEKQENKIK